MVAALLALVPLSGCARDEPGTRPASLDSVVRPELQRLVTNSDRGRTFLTTGGSLHPADSAKAAVLMPDGRNVAARSSPVVLSSAQLNRLRQLLLDVDSYQTVPKACIFSPTITYVLEAGRESVTVVLCHDCDTMVMWSGSTKSHGEVDPVAREFVALSHEIFPKDALIEGILEKKSAEPH